MKFSNEQCYSEFSFHLLQLLSAFVSQRSIQWLSTQQTGTHPTHFSTQEHQVINYLMVVFSEYDDVRFNLFPPTFNSNY
jgi:hypothetical protein